MSRGSKTMDYDRDESRSRVSQSTLLDRVYVGNINAKNASYRDIEEWLDKYGKVHDVALFDRHVLVQFGRESEARKAIEREKGRSFQGCRFDIRLACTSDGSMKRSVSPRSKNLSSNQYPRDSREKSPGYRDDVRERSLNDRDRYNRDSRDNSMERRNYEHPRGSIEEKSNSNCRSEYNNTSLSTVNKSQPNQTNFDAAIVAMSSELLNYAESVEMKLQSQIGFSTHIVVLKEEAHANACIDDLEKKGVLYAFLVNHLNEKHMSCSLRILYGSGQEHRNMLLTNALSFVARNYDDYQKQHAQLKSKLTKPGDDPVRMPPGFVAPDDKVIYQLHLLADSRMLTVDELDEVDDFLQRRIQGLVAAEGIVDNFNPLAIMPNESIQSHSLLGPYVGNSQLSAHPTQINHSALISKNMLGKESAVYQTMDSQMQAHYGHMNSFDQVGQPGTPYMYGSVLPFRGEMGLRPPTNSFMNSYTGYSNQSPVARPLFKQRPQFLNRPQYPGY